MKQFYEGARAGGTHVDRSTFRTQRDMMHSTRQEAVLRGRQGAGGIAQTRSSSTRGIAHGRAPRNRRHSMWQEALLRGSKGVGDTYDKKHFFEGAKGQEAHRGCMRLVVGLQGHT